MIEILHNFLQVMGIDNILILSFIGFMALCVGTGMLVGFLFHILVLGFTQYKRELK